MNLVNGLAEIAPNKLQITNAARLKSNADAQRLVACARERVTLDYRQYEEIECTDA